MTPAYTLELNGISERMNRTIVESVRSMLDQVNIPKPFWAEEVVHAADVRNRMVSPHFKYKTPHELLKGFNPRLDDLLVFDFKTWVHVPKSFHLRAQ